MVKALRFLLRLLALVGALGCAMATIVGQAGRWSDRIDAINHFAPLWLAGGLLAAGLIVVTSRGMERRAGTAIAAVAVALAGIQIAPEMAARFTQPVEPTGETLKVVQFNAYVKNAAPEQSIDWLMAQDADIVVIEEGDGLGRETVKRLLKRYPYCNGCDSWNWFNMILTKRPPIASGRFELPTPDSTYPILGGWSRFDGPGGPFTVIGVHLAWPWQRLSYRQREALAEFVQRNPRERVIVSGDFNMTPWSFALKGLDRKIGLRRVTHGQASWPGRTYFRETRIPVLPFPYLPIDQVYAGDGWRPVTVKRGPRLGSDHYPIVVELTAAPKAKP